MSKSVRWLSAVLMLAAGQIAGQATAQSWPDRPIKFISSQAAGGGTDVLGRLVADQLSARVGQPIIYENRPGGGNVIGTQAAARSAPDGYTFFFATARGAGDRSLYVQVAALRSDEGLHRDLATSPKSPSWCWRIRTCRRKTCRAVRLRQGQPGQARGRHRRRTALLRHDRRLAQQARRHADFLRALHADDAGRAGCARRPRAAPDHRRTDRARPCHERQAPRAGSHLGEATAGLPRRAGGGRDLPGLRFRRLVRAGGADRRAASRSPHGSTARWRRS